MRDARPGGDDELLAAYVDGVAELSPDERRRVEAVLTDPAARADEAATRELLATLRELPREGEPPDWGALARSIGEAVGPGAPRRWWRSWRFAVPALAFAATAVIAMVALWSTAPGAPPRAALDEPPPGAAPEPAPPPALYLDGIAVVLEHETTAAAEAVLDEVLLDLFEGTLFEGEPFEGEPFEDELALAPLLGADDFLVAGELATDLASIDRLDDAALANLERALEEDG